MLGEPLLGHLACHLPTGPESCFTLPQLIANVQDNSEKGRAETSDTQEEEGLRFTLLESSQEQSKAEPS